MNQRVMIAMAIACNPLVLIADEPTTALDVTIQQQILDLLAELQRQRGMALVPITHDMAVIVDTAHPVQVMYAGQMMESRPADALLTAPAHPYTAALLDAFTGTCECAAASGHDLGRGAGHCRPPPWLPVRTALSFRIRAMLRAPDTYPFARRRGALSRAAMSLLVAHDLTCVYPVRVGLLQRPAPLRAVSQVSFTLHPTRTLAVVGESGCGKSTLTRDAGDSTMRRAAQMVFQDPYGSLNPRRTVAGTLEEPLTTAGTRPAERREAALAMMARVGLRHDQAGRYPHMFSGGQRQRIAIARALMLRPRIVVADEPVSALDVSIRAQVLNLLLDL
jgi:peptide/nickel transport system ATP-binding protein